MQTLMLGVGTPRAWRRARRLGLYALPLPIAEGAHREHRERRTAAIVSEDTAEISEVVGEPLLTDRSITRPLSSRDH